MYSLQLCIIQENEYLHLDNTINSPSNNLCDLPQGYPYKAKIPTKPPTKAITPAFIPIALAALPVARTPAEDVVFEEPLEPDEAELDDEPLSATREEEPAGEEEPAAEDETPVDKVGAAVIKVLPVLVVSEVTAPVEVASASECVAEAETAEVDGATLPSGPQPGR